MRATVIGSGSWGTALAIQLGRVGHEVTLWSRDPDFAQDIQSRRENARYLPGARLPDTVRAESEPEAALDSAELVVAVVPSQVMRSVLTSLSPFLPPAAAMCCASKGIEVGTLATMEEVMVDVLPERLHPGICTLSGPSFAREVASGLPTAVVIAGRDEERCHAVAGAFHGGFFRVYHSDDVVGVEYGGALKNVLAIATGAADGAGLGTNARAALITRGLAEITRMAVARGANPLTLMGLAGLGDLVLTCTGDLSRNRRVGLGLGRGQALPEILKELGQVAEGVVTTDSAWRLAQKLGVEAPIIEQVYRVIYEAKPLGEALRDVFGRTRKAERDD